MFTKKMQHFLEQFVVDESGQGITEYAAILAFVAILVGLLFTSIQAPLKNAISNAFSAVAAQLNVAG